MSPLKIVLLNVKFSPNLGDGVIAECLEYELRGAMPGATVDSIDLAGRTHFGGDSGQFRRLSLAVLRHLPDVARHILTRPMLEFLIEWRYRPVWRALLQGAHVAIIGGGHLLADADLNFPLKIAAAAEEARAAGARLAVFSVGVGEIWSRAGAALFHRALGRSDLSYVALRDQASLTRWRRHMLNAPSVQPILCRDPALLSESVYGAQTRAAPRARPLIGVGVMDPATLALHADAQTFRARDVLKFWVDLVHGLLAHGYDVRLFTNGSRSDDVVMRDVANTTRRAAPDRVEIADRPVRPRELVAAIAACDGVIAHRLHANIVAYAYRIPHIGLGWDSKLGAFFESVDRANYAFTAVAPAPGEVVAALASTLDEGVDEATWRRTTSETRESINRLAREIALPAAPMMAS